MHRSDRASAHLIALTLVASLATLAASPGTARAQSFARYEDQVIVVRAPSPGEPAKWTDFYQGLEAPQALRDAQLYTALGRPDLVDKYHGRQSTKRVLIIVGAIVAGSAVISGLAMVAADSCSYCSTYGTLSVAGLTLAGVGGAGGAVMVILGAVMSPHPVTLDEAQRIAAERDAELRKRFGVPEPPAPRSQADGPRWSLAPMLLQGGGGLTAGFTF